MSNPLSQRRDQVVTEWQRCVSNPSVKTQRPPSAPSSSISPAIWASWQRSQQTVKLGHRHAPLTDLDWVAEQWQHSPIRAVAQPELDQLRELVAESDSVVGISDPAGCLLWTAASTHMDTKSADQHFIPGGNWREQLAGTNAVGLCATSRQAVTIFSAEHYRAALQDWVCYAAPILHPQSGELIGVLDISTTWDRHTPLGQSAVMGLASRISQRLPAEVMAMPAMQSGLYLSLLGQPAVRLDGQLLRCSLRHYEILCLLALHPEGMSADRLHHALYGDAPVTKATLKSEVSTLRQRLGGHISSRPYRLTLAVQADFIELWRALSAQRLDQALQLYRGALLTDSNSPMIETWRYSIEALVARHLDQCTDLPSLVRDPSVGVSAQVRERLMDWVSEAHKLS